MGEAEELCDRIGILLNGDMIALDTADGAQAALPAGRPSAELEEVFMAATGTSLEEAESNGDDERRGEGRGELHATRVRRPATLADGHADIVPSAAG